MHSRTLHLQSHLWKQEVNVFQWLLLECFADMQESVAAVWKYAEGKS
jgi:hypothetical protein